MKLEGRYRKLIKVRKEGDTLDCVACEDGVRVLLDGERYFIPTIKGILSELRVSNPESSEREILKVLEVMPTAVIAAVVWSAEILENPEFDFSTIKKLRVTAYTDMIMVVAVAVDGTEYRNWEPVQKPEAMEDHAKEKSVNPHVGTLYYNPIDRQTRIKTSPDEPNPFSDRNTYIRNTEVY